MASNCDGAAAFVQFAACNQNGFSIHKGDVKNSESLHGFSPFVPPRIARLEHPQYGCLSFHATNLRVAAGSYCPYGQRTICHNPNKGNAEPFH
jgi:hypothetical protein